MAFLIFLDKLGKLPESHKQRVAESLATTEHVLDTLYVLEAIKGRDDDDANDYNRDYGWVKPAWDDIVQALGLSLAEYEALVEFKKEGAMIDEFERDDEEEQAKASESLRALQSSTAKVLLKYKEPLVKLLHVFLRA